MSKRERIHITKTDDGWQGKKEGAAKASFTAETKAEAVDKGVDQSKREHGQLIIHKGDGTFQSERTYGKDPYPPKG